MSTEEERLFEDKAFSDAFLAHRRMRLANIAGAASSLERHLLNVSQCWESGDYDEMKLHKDLAVRRLKSLREAWAEFEKLIAP